MIRVRFKDDAAMHLAEFQRLSPDVVQLTGKIPRKTAGFEVYRLSGEFLGDYSDYTEIVGEVENGLQFGKKGDENG